MLCSLFSPFNPVEQGFIPLKPVICILCVLAIMTTWQLFSPPAGGEGVKKGLKGFVWESVTEACKIGQKDVYILSVSTFFFICLMNLCGLIPLSFSMTAHLSFNLPMSMMMWISGVVYSMVKSVNSLVGHLLPLGAPSGLWPLLVIVESVSQIIRPLTLAIRLMANVLAGHLILSLVGSLSISSAVGVVSVIPVSLLMGFESCVSVVQAYVFMSLICLYWSEGEE